MHSVSFKCDTCGNRAYDVVEDKDFNDILKCTNCGREEKFSFSDD